MCDILSEISAKIESNSSFAAYSLPGNEQIFVGGEATVGLFAKNSPLIPIPGDGQELRFSYPATPRTQYEPSIAQVVDALRGTGGKAVISRVLRRHVPENERAAIALRILKSNDTATFRFVFNHPSIGLWMGISPELLLSQSPDGLLTTMALAGTLPADDDSQWDKKNLEEHKIVVDYIIEIFRKHGLNPIIGPTETVGHGSVRHLRHIITAASDGTLFNSLIEELHPTPALAGYPLEKALDLIYIHEKHDRGCYGGYIAVTGADGSRHAFVNLRSMTFDGNDAVIFAGGGITPLSNPATEWDETEAKSRTMLDIIDSQLSHSTT